jgi:flavodoxin
MAKVLVVHPSRYGSTAETADRVGAVLAETVLAETVLAETGLAETGLAETGLAEAGVEVERARPHHAMRPR